MSKKKGQVFSADEKVKIVLEVLKEEQTISQIAAKYGVTTKTITNWKKEFLANASLTFNQEKAISSYKNEIDELKIKLDEYAKSLGKVTVERDWLQGKLECLDLSKKKEFIDNSKQIPLVRQCELLKISRSSLYYKHVEMSEVDKNILAHIEKIYEENTEYGYRMIHQQLLEDGFLIGKERVLKYMRILGISAIFPKKKKKTSIKDKENKVHKYQLNDYWSEAEDGTRKVNISTTNEVWSADITYIPNLNGAGFVYMAGIMDWGSKTLLGSKISNTMDISLVTDVLKDVLSKYPAPKIFNTDQGSQYTSEEHTKILKEHNITISMNGKGRSIDNIAIERFFRTLKYNFIYINEFKSIKELKAGIEEYIHKYNCKRFHSALGYQKPMNVYLEHIKNDKKSAV